MIQVLNKITVYYRGGCPTLRANNARVNVLTLTNEVEVIGQMDNTIDHTFESANRVYSRYGVCPTIPTCAGGGIQPKVTEVRNMKYMIRKLTPKECFRLMNYTDEDYDRAAAVNSNTQLYKQAGNAIVKSCLMAIFSQLNIKGVKPWNEMTVEERQRLVNSKENKKYEQCYK